MAKIRFETKQVLVIYDEQGTIKEQIVVDKLHFVQHEDMVHLSINNGIKTIECKIIDVFVDDKSKIKHILTPAFTLETPVNV